MNNNSAARLAAGIGGMLRGFSNSGNFGGEKLGFEADYVNSGQDVYNLAESIQNKGLQNYSQNFYQPQFQPQQQIQQPVMHPVNFTPPPPVQNNPNDYLKYINPPQATTIPQESQLVFDISKGTEKIQNTLEDIAKLIGYLINLLQNNNVQQQQVQVPVIDNNFQNSVDNYTNAVSAELSDLVEDEEEDDIIQPEVKPKTVQKTAIKQPRGSRVPKTKK